MTGIIITTAKIAVVLGCAVATSFAFEWFHTTKKPSGKKGGRRFHGTRSSIESDNANKE